MRSSTFMEDGSPADGIPRDEAFDASLSLWRRGYPFIRDRALRYGADIFRTRLMLREVYCVTGSEAVEMFYAPGRFTRRGAMPNTVLTLLQGRGSVQMLDGHRHAHRKQLFMSLAADPERVAALTAAMKETWRARLSAWQGRERITLLSEVEEILCRAVCDWAGVPLKIGEASAKVRWFAAMIEGSGSIGARHLRGRISRARAERWALDIIRRVRSGRLSPDEDSPLRAIAWHLDAAGRPLDDRSAAIELINILRPTVASARFIVFAALALHRHPDVADRLRRSGTDRELENFVQEVRRLCPFFPYIGGRALESFTWRGHAFQHGDWFLLDIFGTNRDPRVWHRPEQFNPNRFELGPEDPFSFIPQGGGRYFDGHRCPGERLAIELTKAATQMLVREMRYSVPRQDLNVELSRIPAIPASRFTITDPEPAAAPPPSR